MAVVPFDQIQQIIKLNPNKELISNARTCANHLMMQVFGTGLDTALPKYNYFESDAIHAERKEGAISNQDLFERILKREEMVFSAQGGVSYYDGLNPEQTMSFDAVLDNIRYNMTIRKWVKEFALNAYRTDPMSVLFVEVSPDGKQIYPTYKSISCIYDYQTTGRKVEYIAFNMTVSDCISFGVIDETLTDMKQSQTTSYYRFVDDRFDYIVKNTDGAVTEYSKLDMLFDQLPAIITSDLINFQNPARFSSPLDRMVELAQEFLQDRSIRNLSKKYTGFQKVIEPLLQCGTCNGTGYLSGAACPECTTGRQDKGSGFKLVTKVSDVARFPIDVDSQFDFKKYFGYIAPDITTWDKQDTSLNDLENFMVDTYWGTVNRTTTTGPTQGKTGLDSNKTATQVNEDIKPIYARLNMTADWAEQTENALCSFIGEYIYPDNFKGSARTYGRYYILETPDEIRITYLDAKAKGAPQTTLSEILSKYYHSLYAENKIKLNIALKLMQVEPFVHYTTIQVQAMNPSRVDFFCKMYFSEWLATLTEAYLVITKVDKMLADLIVYATAKMVEPAELLIPPAITESVRVGSNL